MTTFRLAKQLSGAFAFGGSCVYLYDRFNAHQVAQVSADLPNLTSVDIVGAVGNTPLIELKSLSKLTGCRIYAKAEFLNPGGSIKDRAAKYLIENAEKEGLLQPGGTIVEGTGGNTGIGLAILAAAKGYKTIFTMPDFIAKEKPDLMRTLGATTHLQPCVSFSDNRHYYRYAEQLAKELPNAYFPDQFENTANFQAHYETTGPEIWRQTHGNIDGFVCASGTGGTIGGCSKFLKEKNPDIETWLIDPEGGATAQYIMSGKTNSTKRERFLFIPRTEGSTLAEGIGLDRVTANFAQAEIDHAIIGKDQEWLKMAYFLLRNDGIFVGPSAALNAVGAVKLARKLGKGKTIVTILCDGGDRYRTKMYNLDWLKEKKVEDCVNPSETLEFVE